MIYSDIFHWIPANGPRCSFSLFIFPLQSTSMGERKHQLMSSWTWQSCSYKGSVCPSWTPLQEYLVPSRQLKPVSQCFHYSCLNLINFHSVYFIKSGNKKYQWKTVTQCWLIGNNMLSIRCEEAFSLCTLSKTKSQPAILASVASVWVEQAN